jgi:hypothetical protein
MKLPSVCVVAFLLATAFCRHQACGEEQKSTKEGLYKFIRERSEVIAARDGKVTVYKLEMEEAVSGKAVLFNYGKSLKAQFEEGDYIYIKAQEGYGGLWIGGYGPYEPQHGEDQPGAYVFKGIITDRFEGKKRIGVLLLKLGKEYRYYVPTGEDKDDKTVPDAEILGLIRNLRLNTTVTVEIDEYTSPPELQSIGKYASAEGSDEDSGAVADETEKEGVERQPSEITIPVRLAASPPEASRPAAAVAGQPRKKGVHRFVEERSESVKTTEGDLTVYRLAMQDSLTGSDVLMTSIKPFSEEFKSDEYVYVETVDLYGGPWVVAWSRYEVVPGEEQPGAYVLSHSVEDKIDGRLRSGVVLRKLGQEFIYYIPSVPDDNGEEQYDVRILYQIGVLLAKGQLVEVEVDVFSNPKELRSIRHYGASKKGDKVEGAPE